MGGLATAAGQAPDITIDTSQFFYSDGGLPQSMYYHSESSPLAPDVSLSTTPTDLQPHGLSQHHFQNQAFDFHVPQHPQVNPQQYRRASVPVAAASARYDHPSSLSASPMATFFMMPDGSAHSQGTKAPRRRRSGVGSEPVKHRRTRSGCFTCRSRRVKCDETHPICERCQKGGRECQYPDIVPSSKSGSSQRRREKRSGSREGSSSLEDLEEEDGEYQDAQSPPDHGPRLKTSTSHLRKEARLQRRGSWPSSEIRQSRNRKPASSIDQSPSPHDPESSAPTSPAESLRRSASQYNLHSPTMDWSHLPPDVVFYLNYHQKVLTSHHYLQRCDVDNFFKTALFDYAVTCEALLYAVVAFASFHYSVQFKTGAFQTFLEYYNKSASLLRESLNPGQETTVATVITILQLASFEEYLGDWMSLMEHRNAAAKIISQLWTPEAMAETAELRMVYNWFMHFDVLAAMMAGHQTALGREWSRKNTEAVLALHSTNTEDLTSKLSVAMCEFREIAMEASIMTAKRSQNELTIEEFLRDFHDLLKRCQTWWDELDPTLLDGGEQVKPSTQPEDSSPFQPSPLYTGPRWGMNYLFCDYYGMLIVLKHQIALTNDTGPEKTLSEHAVKICEMLTAIDAYPDAPAGALLAAQAPLGLAALWIPPTPLYRQWIQRQLGKCEQMGFIYPLAFRMRISELWGNPQLRHTWISNDSETAIGLTIRRLVDMRDSELPIDSARADIRKMRSLMTEMRLDSKGSGKVPSSPTKGQEAKVECSENVNGVSES